MICFLVLLVCFVRGIDFKNADLDGVFCTLHRE
jgi:hypothetical protein